MSRAALLIVAALALAAGTVRAQTDPRLVAAVRLAQEGLSDSARATVQRLIARAEPTDSLYPQILYTRALLAADPREMRTDLQRVAVEYASSNWADDALLRLAVLEYAGGQLDASARNLEQIALDHSASPLYPRAAYWAGRVYFDLRRAADACRWVRAGRERIGDDAEVRTQLAAYADQCRGVEPPTAAGGAADTVTAVAASPPPPPAADSAPAAAAARPEEPPAAPPAAPPGAAPAAAPAAVPQPAAVPAAPPRASGFQIQIAAVNTQAAADTIAERARRAGAESVMVVREAPFYKVRVGRYSTRAEAAAALPDARKRFRGTPFVVVDRE